MVVLILSNNPIYCKSLKKNIKQIECSSEAAKHNTGLQPPRLTGMGTGVPGKGGCLALLCNSVVDMGCTQLGGMAWYLAPWTKN